MLDNTQKMYYFWRDRLNTCFLYYCSGFAAHHLFLLCSVRFNDYSFVANSIINLKQRIMKNFFSCISILLLIAGLNNSLNAQPAYYNYNTDGSANSFPLGIAGGKQVELLYLAGDFNQPSAAPAGAIVSVAFRINSGYPITNVTYNTMTISMGQANITTLPTGAYYAGTMTQVYNHASVTFTAAGGTWLTIPLDTPFPYDPTQALVVDFGQCSCNAGSIYPMCFTTLTNNRRSWSVGTCPYAYSSQGAVIYHFGINIQTSGPPIVVTTAAGAVTSTTATLNGTVNANGLSTTVSFDYGLTTTYGSTIAGAPSPLTGTVVTPVSANVTSLLPGNTYHFRVKGTNSGGTTNGNDMTFNTPAALPTVITTAATGITNSAATLNGTINANGASTAVLFDWGLTTTYGTTVPGAPTPVLGNLDTPVNVNISGLTLGTTYHFRVKGTNSVGTVNGADMIFTTSNCINPSPPGAITGSTTVCGYSTGKVYSVLPISGATDYGWTVPAGASITGGLHTNSITVTFGNVSGNVTVFGINACGNGSSSTLAITVNPAPAPTISGTANLCVNSGYYNYTTQAGLNSYQWIVSPGGTITWGTGTYQIQVSWNVAGPQTVSVNYATAAGCFAPNPTVMNVTVNTMPGAAGPITGSSTVCAGATGVAYSVAPIAGVATYIWTLPAGATIASGGGTNSITVNFGATTVAGNITVYGNNVCGNGAPSPAFPVTVNPLPDAAGTITGTASVCLGQTGVNYMISPVTNATGYAWTVPSGATIASGANTNSIMVDFSMTAVSGNVSVAATNACGNGTAAPNFPVTVNIVPTPVISQSGNNLVSSIANGNQWYLWNIIIPGAINQSYTPTETGIYSDIVTENGCPSARSNEYYFVMPLGIGNNQNNQGFGIYPNPGNGQFTIVTPNTIKGNYNILIFNTLGAKIFELNDLNGSIQKNIDLRPVTPGIYNMVLQNSTTHMVTRIIIN